MQKKNEKIGMADTRQWSKTLQAEWDLQSLHHD